MQSDILKIAVCISVLLFFSSSCSDKSDLENQITIKITSVDGKTKQPRVNAFDTIEVRKEGFGYLKKTYEIVEKCLTDSTGSVEVKVDRTKGYRFFLNTKDSYGTADFAEPFTKEKLKAGQEVIIEAKPIVIK